MYTLITLRSKGDYDGKGDKKALQRKYYLQEEADEKLKMKVLIIKKTKNNIEHLCCEDYNAMKNHYLLVQISDIIRQLLECGYELIRILKATIKEITSRILESFRRDTLTPEDIANLNKHIQIRCLR